MELDFAKPENFDAAVSIAHAMYEHIARAGMAGMAFADCANAFAIANGMFLAGAYTDKTSQEIAAENLKATALHYARQLANAPRMSYDDLAKAGYQN